MREDGWRRWECEKEVHRWKEVARKEWESVHCTQKEKGCHTRPFEEKGRKEEE